MRHQLTERAHRIGLRHLILAPAEPEVLARFSQDVVATIDAEMR
jgi:hypothetical protein